MTKPKSRYLKFAGHRGHWYLFEDVESGVIEHFAPQQVVSELRGDVLPMGQLVWAEYRTTASSGLWYVLCCA